MAKTPDDPKDPQPGPERGVSRRDFVKAGAASGLGAAALLDTGTAHAQAPAAGEAWDYEFDVVVVGGGCAGLTAAPPEVASGRLTVNERIGA